MAYYDKIGSREEEMTLYIRRMLRQDISQLTRLDHEAFPTEWPPTNFTRELDNKMAYYIVASDSPLEPAGSRPQPPAEKVSFLNRLKQFFIGDPDVWEKEEAGTGQNIIGYAGIWILADEAHITSIATVKSRQRQGIGEALLIGVIEMAIARKCRVVTLEARVSNTPAQNLYTKFGFHKEGVRKGYYLDNHEDAVIMTTDYIGDAGFQAGLERLKKAHAERCGETQYAI